MGVGLWIIAGVLAGWLSSILAGTNRRQDGIPNVLVGVISAFAGGVLGVALTGGPRWGGLGLLPPLLFAVAGALVGTWIWRLAYRHGHHEEAPPAPWNRWARAAPRQARH